MKVDEVISLLINMKSTSRQHNEVCLNFIKGMHITDITELLNITKGYDINNSRLINSSIINSFVTNDIIYANGFVNLECSYVSTEVIANLTCSYLLAIDVDCRNTLFENILMHLGFIIKTEHSQTPVAQKRAKIFLNCIEDFINNMKVNELRKRYMEFIMIYKED